MKILETAKVEDCLEAKNVYDIIIDTEIDIDFIDYLSKLGKLNYIHVFEKPFFKIINRAKYTIRGSEGNQIIRILFPDNFVIEELEILKEFINNYSEISQ